MKSQIKKFNEEILSIFIDNKTLDLMEVDNTIKFEPFNVIIYFILFYNLIVFIFYFFFYFFFCQ